MGRGISIHIAGVNNIGKSTQLQLLSRWLSEHGQASELVKFPAYSLGERGEFIRRYLKDALFRAEYRREYIDAEQRIARAIISNRYDFEPLLEEHLRHGKWVLIEGGIIDSIAWSQVNGLSEAETRELHRKRGRATLTILLNERHGRRYETATESGHVNETDAARIAKARSLMLASVNEVSERVFRLDFDLKESREAIAMRLRRILEHAGLNP